MLFYENKKTGEVFIVRDPELRLDELVQVQDEVAMLLGFGGPAAEAAKAVGMSFDASGKLNTGAPPEVPSEAPATATASEEPNDEKDEQESA
jgi:hypothetical protein